MLHCIPFFLQETTRPCCQGTKTKPGKGGEIQLTDAIDTLNQTQRVFAREYKGDRYDVGNKFGWVKTNIEYGLEHPQVKEELREYIKELGAKLAAEDKQNNSKK